MLLRSHNTLYTVMKCIRTVVDIRDGPKVRFWLMLSSMLTNKC